MGMGIPVGLGVGLGVGMGTGKDIFTCQKPIPLIRIFKWSLKYCKVPFAAVHS
jgi:hypothetical protein